MTKFDKSKFTAGEYVMYEGRFVARFKRGHRASFLSFLVKNFTVEEYFQKLEVEKMAPLEILKEKGYILPHIRKWLKEAGLPETPEGLQLFLNRQYNRA
jgi:intergrase/recombinase